MTKIDSRISDLSEAKQELLRKLLEKRSQHQTQAKAPVPDSPDTGSDAASRDCRPRMDFSLFFFSESQPTSEGLYDLVLDSARIADRIGCTGLWTPERHFHPFGGPYPNPALLAAALATITEHIELRAGSVVLPLHHPLRVVEDWAVVDQLSRGRVSVSFASGWHLNDFVLAPDHHGDRKSVMLRQIDEVLRLWAGKTWKGPGVGGVETEVETFPRPVQKNLPIWLTAAKDPKTFENAGRLGAGVLTALTGQRLSEIGEKVAVYRRAREEAGFDPAGGRVALMLHTFLGEDIEAVRERVRQPMYRYLKTNLGLHAHQAAARSGASEESMALDSQDEESLLAFTFDRYFSGGALFGTRESCRRLVAELESIGITEVACLIDFGLENKWVLEGLEALAGLIDDCRPKVGSVAGSAVQGVKT